MKLLFCSILILLFALDKTSGRQNENNPVDGRVVQQILMGGDGMDTGGKQNDNKPIDPGIIQQMLMEGDERNTGRIQNDNKPMDPSIVQKMLMQASSMIPAPILMRMGISYLQKIFFDEIERETFFALRTGLQPNVSMECLNSLNELIIGLRERRLWAIRMVDSFGKIPSGIFGGTLAAFGDYDMCVDTIVPGKFQGRYCRVAISMAGPAKTPPPFTPFDLNILYKTDITQTLLSSGMVSDSKVQIESSMCIPSTCTKDELPHILSKANRGPTPTIDFHAKECMIKKELSFSTYQVILLAIIIALIIFELAATVLDVRLRTLYPEEVYKLEISTPVKCFLCFSFYTNAVRLFKKDNNPDSIKIFHAMKFLSLMWIILGHTIVFNLKAVGRLYYALKMAGGFFFQIAANPFAATETFFFISGFLVIYSFIKTNTPRINFFLYAFYRYLRLIPPIVFLICCALLSADIGSGPMWNEFITDFLVGTCETTWWKNLLCINNLSGTRNNCLPWTWYVAVDMQLYLATYFLLLLYRKNPDRAIRIVKIIAFASVIILVVNHAYYNLPPNPSMLYIRYGDSHYYTKLSHLRTYNHITPYCFGLITGYLVGTKKRINMTSGMKFIGWVISTLFAVAVVFSTYLWNSGRLPTQLESTLYGSLQRPLWSFMLMWVVYVCMNGDGGVVTSILNWDGFVPLGRLTYMAFLAHPLIQLLAFGQIKHLFFADRKLMIIMFIAFSVLSYLFALVLCLICESPFMGLLNVLISSKVGKNGRLKKKEVFSV